MITATRDDAAARGWGDAETGGRWDAEIARCSLLLPFVLVAIGLSLSPFLRFSVSPRLRLRSLIQREAAFAIEVVKVFSLDEIETGTRHALEEGDDLIVRK